MISFKEQFEDIRFKKYFSNGYDMITCARFAMEDAMCMQILHELKGGVGEDHFKELLNL